MKRVLLVEDDASLGSTLQERLIKDGFDVDWAGSLQQARDLLNQSFDLVILDVGLPDGSGLDFAKEVKSIQTVPFLFVTAQSDAESRLKGYEAGAEEFIPKPFHLKEFLMRVRHVLENHSQPQVYSLGQHSWIDFDSYTLKVGSQMESLSQKEILVLKHLIQAAPKVVSRDELLDRVWGEESYPSQRTVDNVIVRLRTLLGPDMGQRIQSVRGVGYKWKEVNDEPS